MPCKPCWEGVIWSYSRRDLHENRNDFPYASWAMEKIVPPPPVLRNGELLPFYMYCDDNRIDPASFVSLHILQNV